MVIKLSEMNFDSVYILGLCSIIAGFASGFLIPAHSTADADGFGEWSSWAIVQSKPCLRVRTRNCTTRDCKKQEFSICPAPQWEAWSPLQCTITASTCILARTRNCSIPEIKDCQSTEKNTELTVWGDMRTCPCREVTPHQPIGHWEDWSGWKCEKRAELCYIFRQRQCSVPDINDCPPGDNSQLKLWEGTCPCEPEKPKASWTEWGEWECHQDQIVTCVMYRYRQCSDGEDVDCERTGGRKYEMTSCSNCPAVTRPPLATTSSNLTAVNGGVTTASGSITTTNERITNVTASGGITNVIEGSSTFIGGVTTASGSISTARGGITTTSGGNSTFSGGVTTASGSTTAAYGDMTTLTGGVALSSASNTASNGSMVTTTERNLELASWSEWGQWQYHPDQAIMCVMYRSRTCLHGTETDCEKKGGTKFELRQCNNSTAFDSADAGDPCDNISCNSITLPWPSTLSVCGSDGVTYNICGLKKAHCRNNALTIHKLGAC